MDSDTNLLPSPKRARLAKPPAHNDYEYQGLLDGDGDGNREAPQAPKPKYVASTTGYTSRQLLESRKLTRTT